MSERPLYQGVWDNRELRPVVREQMLKAARAFIDEYEIDIKAVKDITFTGSMAGYYWSEASDIDLHIILAFDELKDDDEILRDYYDLAKIVWGKNMQQFICGHEVELYVQDVKQPHHAAGVYSVINNKWLSTPKQFGDIDVDAEYIHRKLAYLRRSILHAADMVNRDPEATMKYVTRIRDKITKMRQSGLDAAGEMSPDNLVFKAMRRSDLLTQLRKLYRIAYTNSMSLNC